MGVLSIPVLPAFQREAGLVYISANVPVRSVAEGRDNTVTKPSEMEALSLTLIAPLTLIVSFPKPKHILDLLSIRQMTSSVGETEKSFALQLLRIRESGGEDGIDSLDGPGWLELDGKKIGRKKRALVSLDQTL